MCLSEFCFVLRVILFLALSFVKTYRVIADTGNRLENWTNFHNYMPVDSLALIWFIRHDIFQNFVTQICGSYRKNLQIWGRNMCESLNLYNKEQILSKVESDDG